jgi:hypothetical protein
MHHTDALDGSAGASGSNLYYKQTEKVKNSAIYQKGIGCDKWRNGASK